MIYDAQYMTLFDIVIDTVLWRFFSDLWRNLIVMDQYIFCSVNYKELQPCFKGKTTRLLEYVMDTTKFCPSGVTRRGSS